MERNEKTYLVPYGLHKTKAISKSDGFFCFNEFVFAVNEGKE
jgi:hypothetical protein